MVTGRLFGGSNTLILVSSKTGKNVEENWEEKKAFRC